MISTTLAPIAAPELLATIGLLILRLSIAWLFLWPLPGLVRDWDATVSATALVFPMPKLVTTDGVCLMPLGAISVGIGIYGRIGGAALALYCIGGVFVHMALSRQPAALMEALTLSDRDRATANTAATIGAVGHVTSAWKNWTVAGGCACIALVGTGPLSILQLLPIQFTHP